MLVFAFRSEIWIVQNFNFTVFEDFCLSLSWKYRFLQNVNHAKVQSKTNKYCKFHVDLTRRRLSKSRFKKLGMVPQKLYRNTLKKGDSWIVSMSALKTLRYHISPVFEKSRYLDEMYSGCCYQCHHVGKDIPRQLQNTEGGKVSFGRIPRHLLQNHKPD